MRLRLASPEDFEMLRGFRTRTFSDELGLQQAHYKDVFNDYFSKNIVLETDGKLVGAVRLAFSREAQEFFISYLFVLPEYRSHSHTGLLLGAIFLLMRSNGIGSVRADSAEENLSMYRSAGCLVIGAKFKKYGFTCDWIPLIYRLGTNPEAEERLIHHAQAQLRPGDHLKWKFVPTVLSCSNMHEYQCAMNWLIASGRALQMTPFLATPWQCKAPFLQDPVVFSAAELVHSDGRLDAFQDLNSSLNPLHRVGVGRNSNVRAIAEMYGFLSRKQVVYVDSWNSVPRELLNGAKSILLVANSAEAGQLISVFSPSSQPCLWGVATGTTEVEISSLLLQNHFEFLGPTEHGLTILHCGGCGEMSRGQVNVTSSFTGERMARSGIRSHSVLCAAGDPEEACAMLQRLLQTGYTAGEAVRFTNLCFADKLKSPLVLLGDPNLRFNPFQPMEIECEDAFSKIHLVSSSGSGSNRMPAAGAGG